MSHFLAMVFMIASFYRYQWDDYNAYQHQWRLWSESHPGLPEPLHKKVASAVMMLAPLCSALSVALPLSVWMLALMLHIYTDLTIPLMSGVPLRPWLTIGLLELYFVGHVIIFLCGSKEPEGNLECGYLLFSEQQLITEREPPHAAKFVTKEEKKQLKHELDQLQPTTSESDTDESDTTAATYYPPESNLPSVL